MGKKRSRPAATIIKPPASSFPAEPFTHRDLAAAVLTLCLVLIAYWPALHGALLWDDRSHVTRPDLQSLHGLWRIWFELGATQQFYPLLHSAFWFEHRLWGDTVLGYHLINVLLHVISALLVVRIMRRLALPGAWLAGFIFALHPVCVEAVAWISEQKSTLSAVLCLSAALIYLRFDRTRQRRHYLLAFGLFLLALLSKSVTATLPAALLIVVWWQRGSLIRKRDIQPLLPWFVVGASAGLFTAWVERTYIGATGSDYALTIPQRVLLAGRVMLFYPDKLVWPQNLTFIYPRWVIDTGIWWQYLFPVAVIAIAAALWRYSTRDRAPLAAFLYLIATLFPVLGFLNVYPFRYSWVADHFQYLASLGIIVPLAATMALAAKRIPHSAAVGASAILIAALASLTWAQSATFRDSATLYTTTLERNPDAWMAHNNLGEDLAKLPGRLPEAIIHYQAALRIKPDAPEPNNNLGNALLKTPGRQPEAIALFETALRARPNYAEAHTNVGNALLAVPGRLQDAIHEHETALAINPGFAEAHYNLANALRLVPGRLPEAITHYQEALQLQPDLADVHLNLGSALSQIPGRSAEALAEMREAARLKPDYPEVHYDLGMVLANTEGHLSDAIAEFEIALRQKPDYVEAHANLGNALLSVPDRVPEALAHLETAVRLGPDLPEARYMLGAALSRIPARRQQAIAECEAALRLQPDFQPASELLGLLRGARK